MRGMKGKCGINRSVKVFLSLLTVLMLFAAVGVVDASKEVGETVKMSEVSASILYATAFIVLLIAYLTAISSRDLIRLLISLEMMFGAVFLSLIPLFSHIERTAFAILILTIFVSCGELLILIAAITLFDRMKRSVDAELVREGGDRV